MRGYVVAGIGTEIGKTVVAAIMVEALDADYWKPIQAGGLDQTDSDCVRRLAAGSERRIHAEAYRLTEPMSPHAAAAIDQIAIEPNKLTLPQTDRTLIVEPAGGLMVPLAKGLLNIDLIDLWQLPVILVSRYYLGSINHTLLSVELLRQRNANIAGLVFNGDTVPSTRAAILETTGLHVVLEIPEAGDLSESTIKSWAEQVQL